MTVFLINLVFGIIGVALFCATCGFGYIIALPILSLASAVMYHSLTHLDRARAGGATWGGGV